jgi:transposase
VVNSEAKVNGDFAEREKRFLERFPNDRACLDYLLELHFGTQTMCPKCSRPGKFHKIRKIPAYACQWCGYHLPPMAKTRFARSRVGLQLCFHAVFLYSSSDSGISARELQRVLGLTYKTAWRIRNTIIDVKSDLPRQQEGSADFETLLDVLTASSEPSRPDRPRRSHAA